MASDDNVDEIEVVETSVRHGPASPSCERDDDDSADDEHKYSAADKLYIRDGSTTQYGSTGAKVSAGARNKFEKERKIGHRRVGVGGEITYKKIQTTQIMGSIQLGIQLAIGGLASKPERDLLMQDFMTVETTNFPSIGSNHTPAHHYSEFKFKNYAPIAFRYFRDLFGIQPDDFLMSMCSAPLRELSNPGASGSIFYLTDNDEFIVKTVQHKEGEFLQKLLAGYYLNLNQNPRTLLPKFFGLYCYQCNSKNVRLVVMNNLLPSFVKLHQKYDLKGSTYKRKASKLEKAKRSPTYKDLDFMEHHPEGILLESDTHTALIKTIQRDCRVLESFKIMDYSLLLGIHNLDLATKEKAEHRLSTSGEEDVGESGAHSGQRDREREDRAGAAALNRSRSINRQRLVAHSTAMESIQAESEPIDEDDDVPPGGIPARNARGERLLLFIGIIDILQSYRLKKKLEHTFKSMIHDGDTVSVHRPGFYAERFQSFMAKTVFKKIPSLDLPEIKGNHRKFRNLVTSYIALKNSPSKRKSISKPIRQLEGDLNLTVSPDSATTAGVAVSSSSVPIATSTPVNTSAGPVSPPPQQTAFEPTSATTKASVQFPAVLKGSSIRTTGASPPHPHLVPSGKVPPPVPPRGSVSAKGQTDFSSGRGDDDFNVDQKRHRSRMIDDCLHDLDRVFPMHEFFFPFRQCTPAAKQSLSRLEFPKSNHTLPHSFHNSLQFQHNFIPPVIPIPEEKKSHRRNIEYVHYNVSQPKISDVFDADEFVSVEKIENSFIVRTSPYPFRPERRRKNKTNIADNDSSFTKISQFGSTNNVIGDCTPSLSNQKFTYSISPAGNNEHRYWKMSRKDKKHSETYAERMRRIEDKQMDAETNSSRAWKIVSDGLPNHHLNFSSDDERRINKRKKKICSSILEKIRTHRSQDQMFIPFSLFGKRLAERKSWLTFMKNSTNEKLSCKSNTQTTSTLSLSKHNWAFLGHAYPEWMKS